MTIIKQKSVSNERHAKNVRNYLDDKDAVLRDGWNIRYTTRWFQEMKETREAFGHNKPARGGAKNTILYHQVLAFLPEECSCNGGTMTPEKCMQYAKQWLHERYPNQEVVFALHEESDELGKRYAVHMAINRSDLVTGKRLDEGRSCKAKRDRAMHVRKLDEAWGLQQVKKDVPNSKIRLQKPRGAEAAMLKRGMKPNKTNIRKLCQLARDNATSMDEFLGMLSEWGVATRTENGKLYVADADAATPDKIWFSLARLDNRLNTNAMRQAFPGENTSSVSGSAAAGKRTQEEDIDLMRAEYLLKVLNEFKAYINVAEKAKGVAYDEFPRFRPTKPPAQIFNDPETQRKVLDYIRRTDELRKAMAAKTSQQAKLPGRPDQTYRGSDSSQVTRRQERAADIRSRASDR